MGGGIGADDFDHCIIGHIGIISFVTQNVNQIKARCENGESEPSLFDD